jgi:hypothetical protein
MSDEKPEYGHAVRELCGGGLIEHSTVSSRSRRDLPHHILWVTNHEHRLARHSLKSLARRTLAFHKTAQGLVDRAWVYLAWRNWTKGLSERLRSASKRTPAMMARLAEAPLDGAELYRERLFPERIGLPEALRDAYEGRVKARPNEPSNPYRHKMPTMR